MLWQLSAADQDAPPFDKFLIELRAAQCGHSLGDRQREVLIEEKKRQNSEAKNRQLQLLSNQQLRRCDEEVQTIIQFQQENDGNLQILLKGAT